MWCVTMLCLTMLCGNVACENVVNAWDNVACGILNIDSFENMGTHTPFWIQKTTCLFMSWPTCHFWTTLQVRGGDQSPLPSLWNSFVGTGVHNGPVLQCVCQRLVVKILFVIRGYTHTYFAWSCSAGIIFYSKPCSEDMRKTKWCKGIASDFLISHPLVLGFLGSSVSFRTL